MKRTAPTPPSRSVRRSHRRTFEVRSEAGRTCALIDHELASVFGDSSGGAGSLFEEQEQRRLADREAALTKRGNELSAAEERVRRWSEHLQRREREIEFRECRVEAATKLPSQPAGARTKIGRNERCPYGSGLKYKRCHGQPVREPSRTPGTDQP